MYNNAHEALMQIQSLLLKNFRNHENFDWKPSSKINCLYGSNGKGKTAVLEALSLLLLRRSFRPGKAWVQEGFDQSFLQIEFEKKEGIGNVHAILKNEKFLEYFVNDKKTRGSVFKHYGVFITPLDLNFIRGEASFRRKLLDELVFELPQGPTVLKDFYKILVQKNKFLKLCKKGAYSLQDKKNTLSNLNEIFFQKSYQLVEKRQEALALFDPFWKEKGQEFLKTKDFSCIYMGKNQTPFQDNKETKTKLQKELFEERENESTRGCCLAGPQRHDLVLFWKKQEARDFLSQGQQKSLLITWKLGQWAQNLERIKESPSLFFDDIFSEIDEEVAQKLITFLSSVSEQSFLTFTEKKTFLEQENSLYFE